MTSIEDWSLSTLSSHILRQQTQLQLRSGNSKFLFGCRPSWKASGLQLQFGNSRFLGAGPVGRRQGYNCNLGTRNFLVAGPVGRRQGCNCSLRTRGFFGGRRTATTAIWELEFWVAGPVGKWATTAIWVLAVFFGGWAGPVRLQCETWVFLAAGT